MRPARAAPVQTVAELFARRRDDDNVGLILDDESWSWRQVVQAAAERAALLRDLLDASRPPHVGVLLGNVPEYVFLLGAAALAGATVVGVNPTRRGAELARDVRHTDCQLLITDERGSELLTGLDVGVPLDRQLSLCDGRWQLLLGGVEGAALPDVLPDPATLYTLLFTSGSTDAPKAVRCTQRRMAAGADLGFRPTDVLYCVMPLFHGNALVSNLVPGLSAGARIVLREQFSASQVLADVRRHDVTFFNTVGRALSYVLATPPSEHDRDHVLRVVLAPEASSSDAAAFSERFGVRVLSGYGSSEGAIRMVPVEVPDALGVPPPDQDVAVVDPATRQERPRARFDRHGGLLNAEECVGEIVRRDAGAAFEGYYRNDEAEAERRRGGWYWSGDLGYRDEDGVFYFAGRSGDWLRVDSENFAAAPVERVLARAPGVAGVAVYPVPDAITGDAVMAALEMAPRMAFDAAAFLEFLREQRDLGPKWAPRFVRIVPQLPVTGVAKIDKRALRAQAWLTRGEVWWRPDRRGPLCRLGSDDAEQLRRELESRGRLSLLSVAAASVSAG